VQCLFGAVHDLVVREAEDTERVPLQRFFAKAVALLLGRLLVDGAVDLDDESGVVAKEVGDEAAQRMLPPKLTAMQPPSAHELPEQLLARRCALPQFSCSPHNQRRRPPLKPLCIIRLRVNKHTHFTASHIPIPF
jgi:hypothetical protein